MKDSLSRFRQLVACLPAPLRSAIAAHETFLADKATEIRLRVNRPVCIQCLTDRYYLTDSGGLTACYADSLKRTDSRTLAEVLQSICAYSVYSRQKELVEGFVTLRGGHRAGICGTAVMQNGSITHVRDLSSIHLRFCREVRGCADRLLRQLGDVSGGVLLVGEPCSGKTTLLRDLARQLSLRHTVSLMDERGELAACVAGEPQNDVGMCDVYSGYPKAEAMLQSIRSMAPEILICDEIGSEQEAAALERCLTCGAAVIATAHGSSLAEMADRRIVRTGAFSTLVLLAGRAHAGEIAAVRHAGDCLAA